MRVLVIYLAASYIVIWLVKQWFSQRSYIGQSGAYPNSMGACQSTHYFELYVLGHPLTQLLIEIPDGICINGEIAITYSLFDSIPQRMDVTSAITFDYATICFPQPIPPGAMMLVSLQKVRSAERSSQTWLYPVYGRNDAMPFTFLGIARIRCW